VSSLQARLRLAIGAGVVAAVSLSLLVGAYLVRRSLEQSAFDGLRRQVTLLADEEAHPPAGSFGRFLATQDERLSVLPRKQAQLLLPDRPSGRITINGRKYLYATKSSGRDIVVLLRTASSVHAANEPFWIAFAAAAALGCVVAALLAALLARGIARPLVRVTRATSRLARGEAPGQLPVAGSRELRELSESFNAMASELSRARSAERSFLLSVSHELKTPLTAIRAYSEALDDGVLTPERAGDVIGKEAARLERLIMDLINLARLDQRRFDIQVGPLDLAEIAADTAERHAARALELGVRLEVVDGTTAPARADRDRLLQAVSNLVENALRCTPPGGIVTLAAAPGELKVRDTGPGLAPDELPRAFDRFFLYRRYNGDRSVGSGLGLAIVRELARAMDGDVAVASSASGTEFTIRLPLYTPLRARDEQLRGAHDLRIRDWDNERVNPPRDAEVHVEGEVDRVGRRGGTRDRGGGVRG
jgi:signal transduction histidine kinase